VYTPLLGFTDFMFTHEHDQEGLVMCVEWFFKNFIMFGILKRTDPYMVKFDHVWIFFYVRSLFSGLVFASI